jgi:hypothetical protein
MKNKASLTGAILAAIFLTTAAIHAEAPDPAPPQPATFNLQPSTTPDAGLIQPVLDGLLGHYGWLTTVLLAIGSLRILFKPVMLVVENSVKNDPVKLAEVQKFEAGPIYKTIATVLDVGASIKLPLVKPPGPPSA